MCYRTTPRKVRIGLEPPDFLKGDRASLERRAVNVAKAPRERRMVVVVGDAGDREGGRKLVECPGEQDNQSSSPRRIVGRDPLSTTCSLNHSNGGFRAREYGTHSLSSIGENLGMGDFKTHDCGFGLAGAKNRKEGGAIILVAEDCCFSCQTLHSRHSHHTDGGRKPTSVRCSCICKKASTRAIPSETGSW
jgi:hypothetical protein